VSAPPQRHEHRGLLGISNAGVADFYVVFAVSDRERRRCSAFLVEADRPGFSIGTLEHKLGIKGSPDRDHRYSRTCACRTRT